jgi:hypothetical protein
MPSVEITFDGSIPAVILAAGIAIAAAILFYRFTLPVVSPLTRMILSALRAAALGLTVFLIFAPALRLVRSTEHPPRIGVLIDGTASMKIRDGGILRSALIDSLVRGTAMDELAGDARIEAYAIGAGLSPVRSLDSLAYAAPVTDISAAVEGLALHHRRTPFNAVLLLSDGAYNRGEHPSHAAERLGVPIVTVGIGDTSLRRDVLVARVSANSIVYEGVESPVDVTIRSSGAAGERVDVRLFSEGRALASVPLTLSGGSREYSIHLSYVPGGEGVRKYTVDVSGLRDELTAENNRRPFFARVLKSKLRVVILAGGPSADLTSVRLTLSEVERFAVSAFAQRPNGGWYGTAPPSAALDSADCLVLIGYPTASTPQPFLQLVARSLQSRGTPMFFIGGRDVDHARLRSLGDAVPFEASMPSVTEQLVGVEPVPSEHANALLTLSQPEGVEAWRRLPPAIATLTVITPRPGSATLAGMRTESGLPAGPMILTRSTGGRKSLALLAHGIWRWRLMGQGRPETTTLLSGFLTAAVEWLTTREDTRPFRVTPAREVFAHGEPAEFTAELYDANNRPVPQAEVSLTARAGETQVGVALQAIGNGRYEGRIEGLPEGDYAFEARATDGGTAAGKDAGRFLVGGVNIEFQDTRMNQTVLQEMATATGGAFFTVDRFDSAVAAVRALPAFVPSAVQDDRRFELWRLPAILGAVIALFAVEWYLRKRSGML